MARETRAEVACRLRVRTLVYVLTNMCVVLQVLSRSTAYNNFSYFDK